MTQSSHIQLGHSSNIVGSIALLLTDAYVDLIAERIDVAVRLGTLQDSSYQCRHVRTMEFFICASPEYGVAD